MGAGSIRGKVRWKTKPDMAAFYALLDAGEAEALAEVKQNVQKVIMLTVGTQYFSFEQLKALRQSSGGKRRGPYSLVAPNPPMAPGVINMQSGTFYDSIVALPPTRMNGQLRMAFISTDDKAAGVLEAGSYHMIKRDFRGLLQRRILANIQAELGAAARTHLKVLFRG